MEDYVCAPRYCDPCIPYRYWDPYYYCRSVIHSFLHLTLQSACGPSRCYCVHSSHYLHERTTLPISRSAAASDLNSSPLRIKASHHHEVKEEIVVQEEHQHQRVNLRSEYEREEEEYRIRRLQEDAEYISKRRREAEMLCSKVEASSTMAETKKATYTMNEGPVKAYDLPRQIEENGPNETSGKKKCECEESESKRSKLNRTISYDNERSQFSGRLKKIKAEYFPKKSCSSGLCGGYTNKEQSFNLYPLKRGRSSQKSTHQDCSITPYSKVGRPSSQGKYAVSQSNRKPFPSKFEIAMTEGKKECKSPSRILLENDMKSNVFNIEIKEKLISNKLNSTY